MQLNTEQLLRIRIITYIHSNDAETVITALGRQAHCRNYRSLHDLEHALHAETLMTIPEVLLIEVSEGDECFQLVSRIRKNILLNGLIIVMLAPDKDVAWIEQSRQLKIHDYYEAPYPAEDICERLAFLVQYKLVRPTLTQILSKENYDPAIRMPAWKRVFDVIISGAMLLMLAPILIFTAVMIRLESPGPIVYRSKRVGSGYKIFDFYKFRSMFPDAEQKLAALAVHNQYHTDGNDTASAFIKLKNDPRITRVGQFIRKTSIDELPQLFNILKGDMSMVGNRPLPLYEAEMLTSDEWSWRFLAPSGLTGLWQISKRGRADMSERERKKLDNFYAKKYSMLFDLKILLKTLPAAFQKENV